MGLFNQGILGAFSGKVGAIIGSTWKNRNVLRAKARKVRAKKTQSPELIAQRARFALASKFLTSMGDLLKITFPEYGANLTGRNSALSFIIKESISGAYPDFELHYDTIKVAKGSITKPMNPSAAAIAGSKIHFTWMNNSGMGSSARTDDKAVLIAYCPELEVCMFSIDVLQRQHAEGILDVKFFAGRQVHTWMAFMNSAGKKSSDSMYTGLVTVA